MSTDFKVDDQVLYQGRRASVVEVTDGRVTQLQLRWGGRSPLFIRSQGGLTCFPLTEERAALHGEIARMLSGLLALRIREDHVHRMVWDSARDYGDEQALLVAQWLDSVRVQLLEIKDGNEEPLFSTLEQRSNG